MKKVLLFILLFAFIGNVSFGQNPEDKTVKAERLLKTYFSSSLFQDAFMSNYGVRPFEFKIKNRGFFHSFSAKVINAFELDNFSFDTLHIHVFNVVAQKETELDLTNTHYTDKKGIPFDTNKGPGDPCTNMDFETGDFTGWELFEGTVNANPYEMVGATQIGTPGASHVIMTPGTDALVGIPTTNPNGGNFSVMLGNGTGTGGGAASLRQTFLVSAANAVFTYSYALVLEDPSGHTVGEKPFFKINMYDQNGDPIQCGDYQVISGNINSGGDPDFVAYSAGYYLPWKTAFAPLDNYIGQNVTIEFITGDCSQSGHYGYGYIDAECSPLEVVTSSPQICGGDAVTLTAPPGGASYLWSTGETTQEIVTATPGTYDVEITPVTGASCAITMSITITGSPGVPTAIFDMLPNPLCDGESFTVTDNSTATNGSVVDYWNWDFGDGTNLQGGQSETYTYGGPGTYNVQLVAGTGGCYDTLIQPITVTSFGDPTITQVGPYCTNDPSVTLAAIDAGGTWSATCGSCVDATTGSFDPGTAGDGFHDVTYTLSNGTCLAEDMITIEVNQSHDASIAAAGPFCDNEGLQLMNVVEAGGIFSATCGTCINGATGNFNPTIAGAGTHTVTYTFNNPCGDVQSIDIDVNPSMNASITSVGPLCLNNGSINLVAVDAGGIWSGAGITDANLGTFDPALAGAGTHVITYDIAGMCGDLQTTTIEVYPALTVQVFPGSAICLGETTNISALASGGDGNYFYSWDNNGGNLQSANVSPVVTTTYTVTVTDGCESVSDVVTVTVNPLPDVNFSGNPLQGCLPLTVDFTDIGQPTGSQCSWSFGDGEISTNCAPVTNTYTEPGCFDVTLTVVSPEGCISTNTLIDYVCAYDNPTADFSFGPQPTDYMNTDIEFTNQSSDNAVTFDWQFGSNGYLGSDYSENPSFYFPGGEPGTYEVCLDVSTINGCVDDTCQFVVIDDVFLLYVPNAFTPDGDGINDEFSVVIDGYDVEAFELLIFDRWGLLIWSSETVDEKWDGSIKGTADGVVQDVYVWKVNVKDTKGKLHENIGHVTLLK